MRIALFAPLSPCRSALVDHIEGLIPHLAGHYKITTVTSGDYQPTSPMFRRNNGGPAIPWETYDEFRRHPADYDLVIYQLGDEATLHGYMFDALQRWPGLVLLHDLVLHHAILGMTVNRGDPGGYVDEMRYSYGDFGEHVAQQVMSGHGDMMPFEFPLCERVIDNSLAVVGFNQYMCEQVRQIRPDLPTRYVPYQFYLPEGFPSNYDGAALRAELGLTDRKVAASFGFFIPDKRLGLCLRAFQRLVAHQPDAVYLLVGGHSPYYDLPGQLSAMGLSDSVRLTGWQTAVPFVQHMHVPDLAVHLRWPHIGGTLYTPIRLLGLGVPTITSAIEPLAELPADGVVRITPNAPDEEEMLVAAMDYMLSNPSVAQAMAANGRRYVQREHALASVVDLLVGFIDDVASQRRELAARVVARRRNLSSATSAQADLARVAGRALAGLGFTTSQTHLLGDVAEAVDSMVGH